VTAPESRSGQPKPLDAGGFQPEISSFRLYLAAEGKSAKTVRTYTEAVQWFAAGYLLRQGNRAGWEEVARQDLRMSQPVSFAKRNVIARTWPRWRVAARGASATRQACKGRLHAPARETIGSRTQG
jgi:hypothetical protein